MSEKCEHGKGPSGFTCNLVRCDEIIKQLKQENEKLNRQSKLRLQLADDRLEDMNRLTAEVAVKDKMYKAVQKLKDKYFWENEELKKLAKDVQSLATFQENNYKKSLTFCREAYVCTKSCEEFSECECNCCVDEYVCPFSFNKDAIKSVNDVLERKETSNGRRKK